MKELSLNRIQLNLPILPAETSEKITGVHDEVVKLLAEMLLLAAEGIQKMGGNDETK